VSKSLKKLAYFLGSKTDFPGAAGGQSMPAPLLIPVNTPHIGFMNFDLRNEIWLLSLGGIVLAAVAAGLAFWLTTGTGTAGLNLPG
jgi:hypothetical protein